MKKIFITLFCCLFLCIPFVSAEPSDIASKNRIFTWTANTEADLAGYKIYHEKKFLVTVSDPTAIRFEYVVDELAEGDNIFNMTAFDTAGNESVFSEDAIFTYDSTAPAAPGEVVVFKQTLNTRVTIETFD